MVNALVLDAGALIALDRGARTVWGGLARAQQSETVIVLPAGVIAQVWRDGVRQVHLVRALRWTDEIPLDGRMARRAGALCSRAGTADVIDASVALAAASFPPSANVTVATSDRDDIAHLLRHLGADQVDIAPT